MPTRNKLQKMNMRVTTSQYQTSGKNNAHLLSRNLPAGEKNSLEQAAFWHEVKKSCVAYRSPFYTLHMPGRNRTLEQQ